MDANGGGFHVQAIRRDFRAPDSGQVWRDHGKFLRKERDDRSPHARRLGIAMQQDHRRALARSEVVKLNSFHLRRARRDDVRAGTSSCL